MTPEGWNTRHVTLDPGLTALVVRGAQLNGSGWRMAVRVRAKRAQRWRRMIAEGVFLLAWLGVVLGAVYVVFWSD